MTRRFMPHAYQGDIISHELDSPRGNIWAGMGMGKTVGTLTALDLLWLTDPGPALVLAPLRVANSTWTDEARKWDHLKNTEVATITGTSEQRLKALRSDASVYTVNYDNLQWLVDFYADKPWPFSKVVADESTRLKGFRTRQGTKRAKAIGSVAHKHVARWINLTGTPAPNGLKDLWGQSWFVDAGERLGRTYTAFEDRWFSKIARGNTGYHELKPHAHSQAEIEGRLRDVSLALNAKDYFDLKEPIVREVKVRLPPKARALYTEMEKRMFMELDGFEVEAVHAAAKTVKCLQIASGAAIVDDTGAWREIHDAKIQALESIVEEAAGAPVLVAYQFKSDLVRLLAAFPQGKELDANASTIRSWNAGRIPLLFAHPQSAGHGLNLQDGGNILVYFSHWWDAETRAQILERIGPVRQLQAGHDRPVWVYNIVAEDTMDEDVILRVENKLTLQEALMHAMKRRGL